MKTYLLEEMTWPEIKQNMEQGVDTVIICAASIEQHGPALPENSDTVLGYAGAADLAKRLGNALAAPVIRPGLSAHHMCFSGSVTLRPEVFEMVVEDYVQSYIHHGFKKIILISSHGGNFRAIEAIADRLCEKYPKTCIVTGCSLDELDASLAEMEKAEGLKEGVCGGHACDWETSVMMHIDESFVRRECLQTGYVGPLTGELLTRFFEEGVESVSPIGVMGDPVNADAERGKRYFSRLQDLQEKAVRTHIRQWEEQNSGRKSEA